LTREAVGAVINDIRGSHRRVYIRTSSHGRPRRGAGIRTTLQAM
jgi:hypothetical protein